MINYYYSTYCAHSPHSKKATLPHRYYIQRAKVLIFFLMIAIFSVFLVLEKAKLSTLQKNVVKYIALY